MLLVNINAHAQASAGSLPAELSRVDFPRKFQENPRTLRSDYGRAQRGDRTAEDGGRQNEVLLRTLKRTRLAQRVHLKIKVF